jgi:HEPN domain-containing protein
VIASRYDESLVDRNELQALSRLRLKEAAALLELGWFDGAFYLAGYSVECALKAMHCERDAARRVSG